MKKTITRLMALFLSVVMLTGALSTTSLAANTNSLTESELSQIEQDWEKHGWVLKQGFWANNSSTGRRAITGVQKLYNVLGYNVTVDGSFGSQMKAATQKFQRSQNLSVDAIIGRGTFNALMAEVREQLGKSPVRDLAISAPTSVSLAPGASTTITINFSGIGIDSFGGSISGAGLTGQFTDASWKASPQGCYAKLALNADSSFKGATVTFNLMNNTQGVIKSHSIKIDPPSQSGYNADAVLADARKDIGKTGSKLGYSVPWCAYYVSDLLRANGISISRAANPRDLVLYLLNSGKGTYYSFRDANTENLIKSGLKRTDLVVDTSRSKVTPQKGDIVIYLWTEDVGSYNWSHVGIAQGYSGGKIQTIEGNTNGGVVAERSRSYDSTVVGILRLG